MTSSLRATPGSPRPATAAAADGSSAVGMRLSVLLGAGASVGARMPTADAITKRLFDASLTSQQGSTYQFHYSPPDPMRYALFMKPVEERVGFLKELKELADRYYEGERESNYEDIAYLAQQIVDTLAPEYENPGLAPLVSELAEWYGGEYKLHQLARDSVDYLHQLVRWMLTDKGEPLDYLEPLYDAFCDENVTQLDIFTLNHDLILDRALNERHVAFSDGFAEQWGTLLLWSDEYGVPSRRLFKLHGAIDWFRYDLDLGDWDGQVSARPTPGSDPWHPKGPGGRDLGARGYPCDASAQFLAGTFNKILAYPTGIYADQHAHFHDSLRDTDAVLVVGYGFRDKAINARLIGWMNTPRASRRMVVVDPAADRMPETARFAVGSKWTGWIKNGALLPLALPLGEQTPWADLRKELRRR